MNAIWRQRIQSQRTAVKVLSRNVMKPVFLQRIKSQRAAIQVLSGNVISQLVTKNTVSEDSC